MERSRKSTLAIYDEHQMQRELLHHQLERMRFEVLFSCKSKQELEKYIHYHSPDILLVNIENMQGAKSVFVSIMGKKNQVDGIIFYNCLPGEILTDAAKKKSVPVYHASGGFGNLVAMIDDVSNRNAPPVLETVRQLRLQPDNPFYKIATNEKYIRILEMLKDGMAVKQIADLMHSTEHTVNTYIKKMHEETGYSNTIQLVYKAREYGVI